jgi:hypothetical protein
MTDSLDGAGPALTPQDWLGLWQHWWRVVGLRGPLSGDVDQAIDASLIRSVGDQLGFVNINAARSGDPELERRITEEVASYGRQLGQVLDALDVLIRRTQLGALDGPDRRALDEVTALRRDVERLKVSASVERVDRLVSDIEAMCRDGNAERAALQRLRQALDGALAHWPEAG